MTVAALILIVALAACCGACQWRLSHILYAAAIVLLLAVACGPIPAYLLTHLQSAYAVRSPIQWNKRNAIVLLGAGTEKVGSDASSVEPFVFSYARIVQAATLYLECRKSGAQCRIIVSGGDPQHHGAPEAVVYSRALMQLGIDPADLESEPASLNTWQNAQFTQPVLERYGADRIVLVASGIQMRRGLLYFAAFGIHATPVRADYLRAILSPLPLAYNIAITDSAIHEYLGIARYRVYEAMGWNTVRKDPGQA